MYVLLRDFFGGAREEDRGRGWMDGTIVCFGWHLLGEETGREG